MSQYSEKGDGEDDKDQNVEGGTCFQASLGQPVDRRRDHGGCGELAEDRAAER